LAFIFASVLASFSPSLSPLSNTDLLTIACDTAAALSLLLFSASSQIDCRTYSNNNNDSTLNYANRYDIKERTHNALDTRYSHNDTQIFEKFVQLVNSQINFNKNGTINAIPIIGYHNIEDDKAITSTDVSLFDAEMKYLHDNGFKILTMSDFGYDEKSNYLYIKK
jgi:hypothetical protein